MPAVLNWEKQIWYPSIRKARKSIEKGDIGNCLNNPHKTAGGYHWCDNPDVFKGIELTHFVNGNEVWVFETKERFPSKAAAERAVGVHIASPIIDNPTMTAGGYHICTSLDVFEGVNLSCGAEVFNRKLYCNELERWFDSKQEAEAYINCHIPSLVINSPNRTAGGYHWSDEEGYFDNHVLTSCGLTPILCWETKVWYKSKKEAILITGIIISSRCVNNPHATAGGFHWCTAEKYFIDEQLSFPDSSLPVLCWELDLWFTSRIKAAEFCGLKNSSGICAALNQPNLTSAGYHWCDEDGYFDGVDLINIDAGVSGPEKDVLDFIKAYTDSIEENSRKIIAPYELDVYLPKYNFAIEYNGNYWHTEKNGKSKDYHINKTNMCKDKGIQLLHIFEHQWNNKSEIFKSVIANKLGFSDKIYARKCKIVELKDCKEFLETNHLQGNCPSSIKLGLTYNGELVSVMTFGKPRFNKSYEYELIRFCNKLNTIVVGGASKLLKYFEKYYSPKSLVSYANLQWSDGGLYNQLGFIESGISEPNYWWVKGIKTLTRYQCPKHKLKDLLGDKFNPDLSEKDNMQNNGYSRLFDCGNAVFIKEY